MLLHLYQVLQFMFMMKKGFLLDIRNGVPFRSIRETAKYLPISPVTLPKKLNTNEEGPFKGYYYYSLAQPFKPK